MSRLVLATLQRQRAFLGSFVVGFVEVHRCDEVPNVGRVCGSVGVPGRGATLVLADSDIQ